MSVLHAQREVASTGRMSAAHVNEESGSAQVIQSDAPKNPRVVNSHSFQRYWKAELWTERPNLSLRQHRYGEYKRSWFKGFDFSLLLSQ